MSQNVRSYKPVINSQACSSCSICKKACPAETFKEMRRDKSFLRGIVYEVFDNEYSQIGSSHTDLPPCQEACPLKQDIRSYVRHIANRRFDEALSVVRETNPLPLVCGYVCHRPCEEACIKRKLSQSVPIRLLKRFVANQAEYQLDKNAIKEKKNIKIAIVGSGPAGLTAAHDLALEGFDVEIFEAHLEPGGMLNWAIPDFRLPREVISKEIGYIKNLGVQIHTGMRFGQRINLEELKENGFEVVILATGTMLEKNMNIPNESRSIGCLDFLRRLAKGEPLPMGENVLVIGGGNAAVDTARKAKRLGAANVTIVYRRRMQEMPAEQQEVQEAIKEGVKFEFLTAPFELILNNGVISGLKCVKTELVGDPDSDRLRPIPKTDSEFVIDSDMIISSIGQARDLESINQGLNLKNPWNPMVKMKDNKPIEKKLGLFTTGDFANGSSTVVEAMASGRNTANAVMAYLSKGKVSRNE